MIEAMDISEALYLWSCLEQARQKSNPYGGDTAEIYVKHLLPSDYDASLGKKLWLQASRSLYRILVQFCTTNNVKAFVNGRLLGEWMKEFQLRDKCDVRIEQITP